MVSKSEIFANLAKQDNGKGNMGKYLKLVKLREEDKLPDNEQIWQILNEGKANWRSEDYFRACSEKGILSPISDEESKKIAQAGIYVKEGTKFLAESLPNGDKHFWLEDGTPYGEKLADGTEHYWDKSGSLVARRLWGAKHEFASGVLINESLPDGTQRQFYDGKQLRNEKKANGAESSWSLRGIKTFEKMPDGSERKWDNEGRLEMEKTPFGKVTTFYSNGQIQRECATGAYGNIDREWDRDGKPLNGDFSLNYPGSEKVEHMRIYKNGELVEYEHFSREGVRNTEVYLRLRELAAKKIKGITKDTTKGSVITPLDKIMSHIVKKGSERE